jgi:hypothetical protein
MNTIIGWLSSALGPYIIGALAGIILSLCSAVGYQAWQISGLRETLSERDETILGLRADLQTAQINTGVCELKLQEQNGAVDAFAGQCEKTVADSNDRARVVIERPQIAVKGTGPEVMNTWLDELLSSRP